METVSFLNTCYLFSEPSVDLRKVSEMVDPNDHELKESVFNTILEKYGYKFNDVVFLMLNKGPKIKCGE